MVPPVSTPVNLRARDWIECSSVEANVMARWPDYRVFLIAADDVDVRSLDAHASALMAEAHAMARAMSTDQVDPHVARWHDAYLDFGVKPRVARPSVDALIRRARSDDGVPTINTLVDLYNAISILHRVPIGGEDLDRYSGAARLIIASGNETFQTTAHGEPVIDHPDPGEPVWVDDLGVTCRRWNWRQTSRTAIGAETRRVAFIIDSLQAPDHVSARRAAEQLADLIPNALRRTITSS